MQQKTIANWDDELAYLSLRESQFTLCSNSRWGNESNIISLLALYKYTIKPPI